MEGQGRCIYMHVVFRIDTPLATWPIKYLPAWLPGADAVKYGARFRPVTEEMLDRPFREIQSGAVSTLLYNIAS